MTALSCIIPQRRFYCFASSSIHGASISSTLSTLQTIVRMAVKKGVLDFYPFLGYSYERPKGEPRSITQDELQKIIDLEIEWANYRVVRDLFVFSCFTGLAISDVRNLREENIVLEEGELCIKSRRMKTKTPYLAISRGDAHSCNFLISIESRKVPVCCSLS